MGAFEAPPRSRRSKRAQNATPAAVVDLVLRLRKQLTEAHPGANRTGDTHDRVRHDRIDDSGCVTLRYDGRLHHIGIGRTHARTHVILLVQDVQIRIIDAAGELLRELILNPCRGYQPTGARKGHTRRPRNDNSRTHSRGSGSFRCPETSHGRADRI